MSCWVLLRGLMRETRHWGDFPMVLQQALPHARLHLLDLPGNGQLHDQDSPSRVAQMTETCRQQLQAMQLPPPYHLLALSLGAMVVCDWAARYPEEVACGVLINTSLRPFSPFYRRLRPHNYLQLPTLLLADAMLRERTILELTSSRPAPPHLLAQWSQWRRQYPVTRRNAWRQLCAAMRYRAPDAAPAVPLLVLSGKGDRLVDPRCSQALARQWRIPLREHPTAGHDLPLDDPQWVATQVREWRQPERDAG